MSQGLEANEERPFMLGIRWMSVNGRSGWCQTWSDGTALPILSGHDDDSTDDDTDEGDDDSTDDDGDDEDDEDDDDDDETDEKGKKKPTDSKRIKELSDEAARYRVKAKTRLQERDAARAEVTTLKERVAKLEKDGGGDEALKARITELEGSVSTLTKERDDAVKHARDGAVERQITGMTSKLNVKESPDFVRFLLDKKNLLTVDDDGDIEDLQSSVKKLIKSGDLNVRSADDEDDSTEEDEGASGARRTRSKSSKRKASSQGLDRATLEKKYPALRR